jgi:hypothetical protein
LQEDSKRYAIFCQIKIWHWFFSFHEVVSANENVNYYTAVDRCHFVFIP